MAGVLSRQSHAPINDDAPPSGTSQEDKITVKATAPKRSTTRDTSRADDFEEEEPRIPSKAIDLPTMTRVTRKPPSEARIKRMLKRVRETPKERIELKDGSGLGTLDSLREVFWDLEVEVHQKVYESEKMKAYAMSVIDKLHHDTMKETEQNFVAKRKEVTMRYLQENAEKVRRVEELKHKIVRDEERTTWQRRHEMSLRGRGASADQEQGRGDGDTGTGRGLKRSRRGNIATSTQRTHTMNFMHLEPEEVEKDLLAITGGQRFWEKEPESSGQEGGKKKRKK